MFQTCSEVSLTVPLISNPRHVPCLLLLVLKGLPLAICYVSFTRSDIITHQFVVQKPIVELGWCWDGAGIVDGPLATQSLKCDHTSIDVFFCIGKAVPIMLNGVPLDSQHPARSMCEEN
jgi:hypothetical protein